MSLTFFFFIYSMLAVGALSAIICYVIVAMKTPNGEPSYGIALSVMVGYFLIFAIVGYSHWSLGYFGWLICSSIMVCSGGVLGIDKAKSE